MKILLVLENAGAGSGRHVIDLTRGLASAGHEVHVVYSPGRLESWFEHELRQITGALSAQIKMVRGLHPVDVISVIKLRKYIRENGPFAVVHGHSSKGGAVARLAATGTGAVRVYTPHAFFTLAAEISPLKAQIYRVAERLLGYLCETIICVSNAEKRHAREMGLAPAKLTTICNGLSSLPKADKQSVRQELGLQPGQVCIGSVGRLAPQKAFDLLIRAFGLVAADEDKACLVIVGSGPDQEELQKLVKELQLENQVMLPGQADGARVMAGFDVFAMTSIYEAFPYVLLEAAQRGLPIVATEVGGTEELVHEGLNGHVLAQGDVRGVAEKLKLMVANPARRTEMGKMSKRIVENFSVEKMVQETLSAYETAISNRKS